MSFDTGLVRLRVVNPAGSTGYTKDRVVTMPLHTLDQYYAPALSEED